VLRGRICTGESLSSSQVFVNRAKRERNRIGLVSNVAAQNRRQDAGGSDALAELAQL